MSALLKSVRPCRTEARERLAEAIERHTATQRQIARLNAALEAAARALYGDNGVIGAAERAEIALKEAKANEDYHLAAVAIGEVTAEANPVKIAERAAAEAEARLDTARRTQDALNKQVKAAERDLDSPNTELEQCVRVVMRSEATALIDAILREAAALQAELGAKRALLSFLSGEVFEWNERELRQPVTDFMTAPAYPWEWNGRSKEHPALAPWHQAREALRQSADAPLPI